MGAFKVRTSVAASCVLLLSGGIGVASSKQSDAAVFTCNLADGLGVLRVQPDGSYAVDIAGQTWLENGTVAVRANQQWWAAGNASLALLSAAGSSGSDGFLGSFNAWTVSWRAGPSTPVDTTFRCYDSGMLSFETFWPEGATGVNASYVSPDAVEGPQAPSTQFPSFSAGTGTVLGDSLGWGALGGPWTLYEFGLTQNPNPINQGFPGTQYGPLWLHNVSTPPGTPSPLAILSPLEHAHMTPMAVSPDPCTGGSKRLSMGLASTPVNVPAGYTTRVGLFVSPSGINAGTLEWGAQLRRAYNLTSRLVNPARDALTEKVSAWTDNGAALVQGWWDKYCPSRNCTADHPPYGNPAQTLVAWKAYLEGIGVPVGIVQMDTWPMLQQADVVKGGSLDFVDWVPRPDMFPQGIDWVTRQGNGVPLVLYSWGYAPQARNFSLGNYSLETSLAYTPSTPNVREVQPVLDDAYAFFSTLRDRFLAYNGTSFEEDNMGLHTMSYQSHLTAVDGVERWWAGFASPWCESAIPVQVCEASPADLLESLKYPCVTNSRDNIDNVPSARDQGQALFVERWHVGFNRLFMAALALQPFADNQWTLPVEPLSSWGNAVDPYVELGWAMSVLSAGPAGVGDQPNATNATLAMACCMADGTLLKPSLPSTYLDAVFAAARTGSAAPAHAAFPLNTSAGRIFQAPSFVPSSSAAAEVSAEVGDWLTRGNSHAVAAAGPSNFSTFATLVAVDVNAGVTVAPSFLTPDLSPGSPAAGGSIGYVALPWARGWITTDALCAQGAPASACVVPFTSASPLNATTGVAPVPWEHAFELWSLAPVFATPTGPWALLGEPRKVVRVSPKRFPWVTPAPTGTGTGSTGSTGPAAVAGKYAATALPGAMAGKYAATALAAAPAPALSFAVVGAPGETVDVVLMAPPPTAEAASAATSARAVTAEAAVAQGVIVRIAVQFPPSASGQQQVVVECGGAGAAAACLW